MRSPVEFIRRSLHPVVFGIWTYAMLHLLLSLRYAAFLRPEFGFLLAAAHFIAFGFMGASLAPGRTLPSDMSTMLRVMVLLLPVLYLTIMPGDLFLGYNAFQKRFVGPAGAAAARQNQAGPPAPGMDQPAGPSGDGGERLDEQAAGPIEITLRELALTPDLYQGKRVAFTGMFFRDGDLKMHFGGRDTAVYRFLMTCCAADAMPLAVAVDAGQSAPSRNDQWVRVEGTFRIEEIDGISVPIVEEAVVDPVETPEMPYLY